MAFFCCDCNYRTDRKSNWIKHLSTSKHILNASQNKDFENKAPKTRKSGQTGMNIFTPQKRTSNICEKCGKIYKFASGLSRHRRECIEGVSDDMVTGNVGQKVLQEQRQQISTLQNLLEKSIDSNNHTLSTLLPKIGNTTNNINNQMTINLFLNEECKNAMNLTDFLDQLQLTLDDLLFTKDNGYSKGIANIIVRHLSDMPANSRPIHCSDKKRLQFYVKDENKWEKDDSNQKIDRSINDITQKQVQQLHAWETEHPSWRDSEEDTTTYIEMVKQVMGGMCEEDKQHNLDVIKRELGGNTNIQTVMEGK